jgi:hypothetical protein
LQGVSVKRQFYLSAPDTDALQSLCVIVRRRGIRSWCYVLYVRYLVKARVKAGKARDLVCAIDDGTLGKSSIAGDEYLHDMEQARVTDQGVATWVETCFCDPPLAEERPYWEKYFQLLSVKDAHSRRTCRHENGTELWACCDCDCTKRLEERLAGQDKSFLQALRTDKTRSGSGLLGSRSLGEGD